VGAGEGDETTLELKDRPEVQEKLARRIKSVELKVCVESRARAGAHAG
jgi:hypothetical protein